MPNDKINLWHYTTLDGLKGILSKQNLWATDYRYLNDSSELVYSKIILQREVFPRVVATIKLEYDDDQCVRQNVDAQGGIKRVAQMETNDTLDILYESLLNPPPLKRNIPYILSFCKADKDDEFLQKHGLLSQWRGYGKDGGFAIVFNLEKLHEEFIIEQREFYHGISQYGDVVYAPDKASATDEIKKAIDRIAETSHKVYKSIVYKTSNNAVPKQEINWADTLDSLVRCAMRLKHKGFSEENEYRFYAFPYCEEAKNNQYFEEDKNKSIKQVMTRSNSGILVPYIKLFEKSKSLPIERICIGPHKDKKLREQSIKSYLGTIGQDHIEVFCSEIPFIGQST